MLSKNVSTKTHLVDSHSTLGGENPWKRHDLHDNTSIRSAWEQVHYPGEQSASPTDLRRHLMPREEPVTSLTEVPWNMRLQKWRSARKENVFPNFQDSRGFL